MGRIRAVLRRPAAWAVIGVVVVLAGVGLAVTQPWRLWIDVTVDEAIPVATGGVTAEPGSAPSDPTSSPGAAEPTVASSGQLMAKAHPASGTVLALELVDGARYLRFEDLATDNGPDLRVVLSTAGPEASDDEVAADPDAIDLGALKGNVGNQNYEVPADVDLSRYRSVVIWCERFTVAFGAAPLSVGAT